MNDIEASLINNVTSLIRIFNPYYESIYIDENTRLEEDLRITGDDAWDFFLNIKKSLK